MHQNLSCAFLVLGAVEFGNLGCVFIGLGGVQNASEPELGVPRPGGGRI